MNYPRKRDNGSDAFPNLKRVWTGVFAFVSLENLCLNPQYDDSDDDRNVV